MSSTYIALLAHRAGLQHELRGLRDRHEIALDIRMRNRHRAATGDLLRKRGTTLPVDPSTLPKRTMTSGVRLAPCRAWQTSSARRFEAPITFAGFTALSVDMRTNFDAPTCCAVRGSHGRQDIIDDGLKSVLLFHEWHVLVRRRMEYHLRAVPREHFGDAPGSLASPITAATSCGRRSRNSCSIEYRPNSEASNSTMRAGA